MIETETPATAGTVDRGDWIKASNAGDPNQPPAENHEAVATPQETIEALQIRITTAWQKAVSSIVETGKVLQEIRKEVPHGDWGRLFKGPNKPPISSRTAGMLMAIAEHPVLSNPKHASDLPASWYSLLLLSGLPADRLEMLIASNTVHADMTRGEIEALLRREQSRERRATFSLDHHEPSPPIVGELSPEKQAALEKFNPLELYETLRQLKRLLIDLQDAQDKIRHDSSLRKQIRLIADRLLTIADGDPVLLLTDKAIGETVT